MASLGSKWPVLCFSIMENFNTVVGFFTYVKDIATALRGSSPRGKSPMNNSIKNDFNIWMKLVIGLCCLISVLATLAPHPIMIK